jgi:hypothetical protein
MKCKTVLGITAVAIMVFLSSANAALHDRGNGLIYDDSLNITWLQNANYAGITMTWDEASTWAGELAFQGYEDWRLPVFDCVDNTCTDGEMGHLFDIDGISSASPGIYLDVRPSIYWSGTEDPGDTSTAYRFNFKYGSDGLSDKTQKRYAWAVRDGDSSLPVAPEPVSSLLFLAGGATFGIKRLIKKRS